jgi:hypothetical protein
VSAGWTVPKLRYATILIKTAPGHGEPSAKPCQSHRLFHSCGGGKGIAVRGWGWGGRGRSPRKVAGLP